MADERQMDDAVEALSDTERMRIIERLKERNAPKPCELCGHAQWQITEYLASPVQVKRKPDRTVLDPDGRLYPLAVLLCSQCGNTKFVNLAIIGLGDIFPTTGASRIRF